MFLFRKQLGIFFSLEQCERIVATLRENHVDYTIRTVDRSSPSVFSMGTRERSGVLFQNGQLNYEYMVYVRKKDLERARELTGLRPIR